MERSVSVLVRAFALIMIVWKAAGAQSGFWMSATGPFGGNVRCLAVTASGILYSGNVEGGVYRSTDDGLSWQRTSLDTVAVQVLAVGDDGVVFAGGPSNADFGTSTIYRSTDGGVSWSAVRTANSLSALGCGPRGIVIAGGYQGIIRSTDNGNNWISVNGITANVHSLALDGFGTVYAGSNSKIYRSTTGGVTWDSVVVGAWASVVDIAIDDAGTAFAATWGNFVHRSTDRGASWQVVDIDPRDPYYRSVAISPIGQLLVLGSQEVYTSSDHGAGWMSAGVGPYYYKTSIAGTANGSIVVGTERGGICRTQNGGLGWEQSTMVNSIVEALAVDGSGVVYAGTGGGLFSSSDRGATWKSTTLSDVSVPSIIISSSGTIFATASECDVRCSGWVLRSTDDGQTWEPTDTSPGPFFVPVLAVSSSGKVFALNTSTSNALYVSANDGSDWTKLADSLGDCIAVGQAGDLYVGGWRGIYRSSDDGMSWSQLTDSASTAIALGRDDWLYALTVSGMIRSSDGGVTWLRGDETLPSERFLKLTVGLQGEVYLATTSHLYVSRTHAADWLVLDVGPERQAIMSLAMDSIGYLYAGTAGGGVIRSLGLTTSARDPQSPIPQTLNLSQNYPNPFNPTTTIEFRLARSGAVQLQVYDALGREVATLAHGVVNAGVHKIVWNAEGLTSGIYFYRLKAGSIVETKKLVLIR